MSKKYLLYFITLISMAYSNTILDFSLSKNETSNTININVESEGEHLLYLNLSSNSDWSVSNQESACISVLLNGQYQSDIITFYGNSIFTYKILLGDLNAGPHTLQFVFDESKSRPNVTEVYFESMEIISSSEFSELNEIIFEYSPFIFGRDLIENYESAYTDIPLLMWHTIDSKSNGAQTLKTINYNIIFSNEDSRISGSDGLNDMMYDFARTTDIEWVYTVQLDENNNLISESYQGAGHLDTPFSGDKIGNHPILKISTLNCLFSDEGTSQYLFALSPEYILIDSIITDHPDATDQNIPPFFNYSIPRRENLMDENPWTYKIMADEMKNENKYEIPGDYNTYAISDAKNYLYIEFKGSTSSPTNLYLYANSNHDCNYYGKVGAERYFNGGRIRTTIELPAGIDYFNLTNLIFEIPNSSEAHSITIDNIYKIFTLDENYNPQHLNFDFTDPINIDNNNTTALIKLNNTGNYDCLGNLNGSATCDACGICNGYNQDFDDCGICFGNNENMDCSGVCFGNAYYDDCSICDDDPNNDNENCNAGCTDLNATNYNQEAEIYDGSCQYDNHLFHVPIEYNTINEAIFYAPSGDTVLIDSGVYYENIIINEKAVNIVSNSNNIDDYPIINGSESSTVLTIQNTNEPMLIQNLIIEKGYGKGISFEDFISNAADENQLSNYILDSLKAGGILCLNSNPTLNNLIVRANSSRNVAAGIGLVNSNAIITNSQIYENRIDGNDALGGGGIAINGGQPTIRNCAIYDNFVNTNQINLSGGGGILCGFNLGDDEMIVNVNASQITNNTGVIGGGIGVISGKALINKTLINYNTGLYGSAISLGEPFNLVISDINVALTNSTIVDNEGSFTAGLLNNNSNLISINTILWNENIQNEISDGNSINVENFFSINSNIRNLEQYNFYIQKSINTKPMFSNNYALENDSPCIDQGTPLYLTNELPETIEFNVDTLVYINDYFGINPDMGFIESNYVIGDINEDNQLNILDIITLVDIVLNDNSINEQQLVNGDLNQDSQLNIFDIIIMITLIINN